MSTSIYEVLDELDGQATSKADKGSKLERLMAQFLRTDPVYAGLPRVPPHAQPAMRLVGCKLRPSAAEVAANPRARSAVLRIADQVLVPLQASLFDIQATHGFVRALLRVRQDARGG